MIGTQDRWRDLFQYTSDGIFVLDKDWRIVAMNPKAEALCGWKKGEVEGQRVCTEIFVCHNLEGRELCDNGCPKQLALDGQRTGEAIEVKLIRKDGSLNMVAGRGLFLPGAEGKKGAEASVAILIRDDANQRKLQETLLEKERRDSLTGLYHRQYFEELYSIEVRRAKRHGGVVALVMLDIQSLRDINTRHGDSIGDRVLKEIGQMLLKSIREVDIAGRFGDDEFVVLLCGADEPRAKTFLKRLRQALEKLNGSGTVPEPITLNVALEIESQSFDQLLARTEARIEGDRRQPL